MSTKPRIKTDFAIVDVKTGRHALDKLVGDHKVKVPITLSGFVVGTWSGDDGTSIEFEIDVTDHTLGEAVERACACIRCAAKPCGKCFGTGEVLAGKPGAPEVKPCPCGASDMPMARRLPLGERGVVHAKYLERVRTTGSIHGRTPAYPR